MWDGKRGKKELKWFMHVYQFPTVNEVIIYLKHILIKVKKQKRKVLKTIRLIIVYGLDAEGEIKLEIKFYSDSTKGTIQSERKIVTVLGLRQGD